MSKRLHDTAMAVVGPAQPLWRGADRQPRRRRLAALVALLPGQLDLGRHQRDPAQRHRRAHARPAPRKEREPHGPFGSVSTGMQRRILTLIAVAALAVGLAACGSSSKSIRRPPSGLERPRRSRSTRPGFTFTRHRSRPGSTVTVKNDSASQHTVTAGRRGGFNVTIDAGKTATFTAPARPGRYKFHCNIHSFMKGTLTVT